MKLKRFISTLLCAVTLIGCFSGLSLPVFAAEAAKDAEAVEKVDYYTAKFNTQQEKLDTMEKMVEKDGYELWVEKTTGEVAIYNTKTDSWLMSNPYDITNRAATSATTVDLLLSQVVIRYSDDQGKQNTYGSFKEAAMRDQIKFKPIKGGLRVEYVIGREEKRKLVPKMIEKSSFEENIMANFEDQGEIDKMEAYYLLKDPNDPKLTERQKKELMVTYPQTSKYAIYVFDPGATERELNQIEGYIKKNAPNYTMDMLDADHQLLEYVGTDKAPPLFKLALEYYLDEDGLYVRLPGRGIRFDESTYKMDYISILPYMGCGARERYTYLKTEELEAIDPSLVVYKDLDTEKPTVVPNIRSTKGYNFLPDGSGALVRFEDLKDTSLTLRSKVYGPDYAFNKISGNSQEKYRLPVFGTVEENIREIPVTKTEVTPAVLDPVSGAVAIPEESKEVTTYEVKRKTEGFLGIIVEGDSTAEIQVDCGGNLHQYNTTNTYFFPRPSDQFFLDSASAGSSALWTVTSKRKYTGNYIIRYIMLADEKANYVGMAEAYRKYLLKTGVFKEEEKLEANKDIPLYLEAFGLIQTAESFYGIPMEMKTPLTTFDDAKSMIDILNENGISNVNLQYLGWANNGMYTYNATDLKVEKKLGGKDGIKELAEYARSKGATIFPDLDFIRADWDLPFDHFSYKNDTSKTMDNMVAVEQMYSPIYQVFRQRGYMMISPKRMLEYYNRVWKKYEPLNIGAISVASMGSLLNSDFRRSDPYNRDDSKKLTLEVLEKIKADNSKVLVDCGNAFTLQYVTDIVKVPLDSSRFTNASEAIPFMGMVLHGYKNFAGEPINMAGDYGYAFLKALENGASPYFILSYQNTSKLKNTGFYDFYSVNFETWLSDVVDTYSRLNSVLKGVSDQVVTSHEFVNDDSRVVKISYSNGRTFVLNYNNYPVTVDGKEIAAVDFLILQ